MLLDLSLNSHLPCANINAQIQYLHHIASYYSLVSES